MAYDYQGAIASGANPDDVVKYLSSNTGYDATGAITAGANRNDVLKYMANLPTKQAQAPKAPVATADERSASQYGATFPSVTGENPLVAGAKATGNIPSSAFNLGKNVLSAVMNPIDTLSGIGNTVLGGINRGIEKVTGYQVEKGASGEQRNATFDALASALKERYGSLENLQRTATNDPFGFGSDVLGVIDLGAGAFGQTARLANIESRLAQAVTRPATAVIDATRTAASKATKFGVSQATGLSPETIANVVETPSAFKASAIAENTRANLASSVKETIDARLENLSDIGSGYETIRKSPGIVEVKPVQVILEDGTPKITSLEQILSDNGIKLVDGKVKMTSESLPMSATDRTALEDFIGTYGNEKTLSNNAFLNTRQELSRLAKYEEGKTGNLQRLSRELRDYYDSLGKDQITGLKDLDAKYAPEVGELKQIKKDYLQANGEFKDGAINKIANLSGKGKDQVLARLEAIQPGVTQRIKVLKAAEDIEASSGLKVGTYARVGTTGLGVATGNIPLIIASILAVPEVAVPLIRAYGVTANKAGPIVEILKRMANDVNGFRMAGQILPYVQSYLNNSQEQETK